MSILDAKKPQIHAHTHTHKHTHENCNYHLTQFLPGHGGYWHDNSALCPAEDAVRTICNCVSLRNGQSVPPGPILPDGNHVTYIQRTPGWKPAMQPYIASSDGIVKNGKAEKSSRNLDRSSMNANPLCEVVPNSSLA